MGCTFKSGRQTNRLHTQIGNVFNVLSQNFLVQANHGTVFKQIGRPFFFLLGCFFEEVEALILQFIRNFSHFRIIGTGTHQVEHMLGAGQMQGFIAGNQLDDFGIALHQFALGKGERAGE